MNKTFNSDSTYCSDVEGTTNKYGNRGRPSAILNDVASRVQDHLEGKQLLTNYEIKGCMEVIENIKANTFKLKNKIEKLKSTLGFIFNQNIMFEENVRSENLLITKDDPVTDVGISQDIQMLCNFNNQLEPMGFPVANDNETSSFQSDMLTNLNFLNTQDEIDNSAMTLSNNRKNNCCDNQNVYSDTTTLDLNNGTQLSADLLDPDEDGDSPSYIRCKRKKLDNVESISFCTDMLSGHNFIDSSKDDSQLTKNCNTETWSTTNAFYNSQSLIMYPDNMVEPNNSDRFPASDNCLENSQNNNDHQFENSLNCSTDMFSGEKSIETQYKEPASTINSTKCYLTSKRSRDDEFKLSSSKKSDKIEIIENISINDASSIYSNITNYSSNNSIQMIISDSFCDTIIIDSNSMDSNQKLIPVQSGTFKKPKISGGVSTISYSNDVISSTESSEEMSRYIRRKQIPNKHSYPEKNNNTKVLSNKTTFEDSCNELCILTTKFLKIIDDRDVEINGKKCVSILNNIVNPGNNNKNVKEIGTFSNFLQKSFNKKINNLIYNIGTNSTTWKESSEDLEEMGRTYQEISVLLMDVVENIYRQEPDNVNLDTFKMELEKCLDPEDVAELDLKTVLQSNNVIIQDISKSFKNHIITDSYFQSTNLTVTDAFFDWRSAQM